MAKRNEFVEYLLDLLSLFGNVSVKAMFGGYGIYHDGLMFGLVADDVLYLKVDDENRNVFEEKDLEAFGYEKNGKIYKMSYHRAPEEALENPHEMLEWAETAYGAALRSKSKKSKKQ